MENPKDLKYSKEHEWIKVDNDIGTVGISDFAQHVLTDIVFVELPEIGKKVEQMKSAATIESIKSVSDIFSPVSGTITEVNEGLKDNPEIINTDPYGKGWIFKVKIADKNELGNLMSVEEYNQMTQKKE